MTAEPFNGVDHLNKGFRALEVEFGSQNSERAQMTVHVLREKKITAEEMQRAVVHLIEKGCAGKFPRTSDILHAARPPGVNLPQSKPRDYVDTTPRLNIDQFDPNDRTTVLGYFKERKDQRSPLDGLAYTPADLAGGFPNRVSVAALYEELGYLTLYGNRDLPVVKRAGPLGQTISETLQ